MKKKYIRPSVELVRMEHIMEENPYSVGAQGKVDDLPTEEQGDATWDFGGGSHKDDIVDAKWNNTWDTSLWDEE